MKAIVRRGTALVEDEVPDVLPGAGQVLVRTLACGICGSDLHAVHQLDVMIEAGLRAGAADTVDLKSDLVMGHEFCAEILDYGVATTRRLKPGTRVVSVPFAIGPLGPELIGYSTRFPGGYGERMALTEAMLLEVPNGLSSEFAAMVEPMAVGAHAAGVANLERNPVVLVIGCGPVGLAVISSLKARGVGPVVACDFVAERRRLAEIMGADIVIDPSQTSPHAHWNDFDVPATLAEHGVASISGRNIRPAVIFECVGVPGLLNTIIEKGPPMAQIVVVGVCMGEDRIMPVLAINKQLRLDFVFAYTAAEFQAMLSDIAEGRVNVAPLYSGTVGRSGVAGAFQALGHPDGKVKIMVDPGLA